MKRFFLLCLVLVGVTVIFLGEWLWPRQPPDYSTFMRSLMEQKLSWVDFQPGMDYESIRVDDPKFLANLASWLPKLREPHPNNSLKQSSVPLVLVFKNGHREELKFSGASAGGYALVYWQDRRYLGYEDPFTELLKGPKGTELLKKRKPN